MLGGQVAVTMVVEDGDVIISFNYFFEGRVHLGRQSCQSAAGVYMRMCAGTAPGQAGRQTDRQGHGHEDANAFPCISVST